MTALHPDDIAELEALIESIKDELAMGHGVVEIAPTQRQLALAVRVLVEAGDYRLAALLVGTETRN
jgi:hypothetical protein